MKKTLLVLLCLLFTIPVFSQTHDTVDLGEDVYTFLTIAQEKGYCKLINTKPYTEQYIISQLKKIKESCNDDEIAIAEFYISRLEHKDGIDYKKLNFNFKNSNDKIPMSFNFGNTDELYVSSGFYNKKSKNETGYEIFHNLEFYGDIGNNVSYRSTGYIGLTKMDLEQVGEDYSIGYWWYDPDWDKGNGPKLHERFINTYRNNSVLPYSYKKKWDGSIYYLSNLSGSGLEGWPFVNALGFGMYGDLRGEFFDGLLNIGMARIDREWAAMDDGSSLVLNKKAAPFLGIDANIQIVDWFSFSTLTGFLEFPNASYINHNAWYLYDANEEDGRTKDYNTVDSYYFHNAFSIAMMNFDFNYLHIDFGSTSIWPKRFELGYLYPLIDNVVYQNSVGDYDNLGLFGNIKGILPGYGSIWASLFLDEAYSFKHNPFIKTRMMYAYQGGAKVNLPFLPYSTISLRYTKIEPYCYTHQAIRKQPYYNHYLSESYTNNGTSLGYYLQPNSDELFIRIDSKPKCGLGLGLQYQFMRHGADYGSGQVRGSSIWSELPNGDREKYYKYFLHDGAYEWSHVIAIDATYDLNRFDFPLQFFVSAGYIYDYWTRSEGGMDEKTPYHKINTSEYPTTHGAVVTIGIKAFSFANFQ